MFFGETVLPMNNVLEEIQISIVDMALMVVSLKLITWII